MLTYAFWFGPEGTMVRAVRTFAQGVLSVIGYSALPFNAFQADWKTAAGIGLGAALLSVLQSLDRRESLYATPPAS